jgi:predicted PurR-regulated permease PerM
MLENKQYIPYQSVILSFLAVVVMTAFLYFASPIIVPLVVALVFAYILSPPIALLRKLKIPHPLAVIIVLIVATLVLGVIGYFLFLQVASFVQMLPSYWHTVVEHSLKFLDVYKKIFPQGNELDINKLQLKDMSGVTKFLFHGLSSTLAFLATVVLVLFFTFFILNDQEMLKRKIIRVFDKSGEGTAAKILVEINSQIRRYLVVQFLVSLALAVVFTVGFSVIGIDYAYIWGPLFGLLNVIPNIGAIIATIPPLIVAGIQFDRLMPVFWVLILSVVIQTLEGNIIKPKLFGQTLNLNPLAVLVSLVYWTWIWGAIGIVLAIPITAAIKVVCDHFDTLEPIGVLLGGNKEREAVNS